MYTKTFLRLVTNDCSSFTEGMNESIRNGASFANELLTSYLGDNVNRTDVLTAITRIADRTTYPRYNLDFKMGMTYFVDSISHVSFINDMIDPIEYWSFVSMMGTLRLSYITPHI